MTTHFIKRFANILLDESGSSDGIILSLDLEEYNCLTGITSVDIRVLKYVNYLQD